MRARNATQGGARKSVTPLPINALTITQPWAYFIVNLPLRYRKRIENRTRNIGFHDSFWVHTSKKVTVAYYEDACSFAIKAGVPERLLPSREALHCGKIIGRVTCTLLLAPDGVPHRGTMPAAGLSRAIKEWYWDGWGYVVSNAVPGPILACSGARGFWRVPPDVLAKLGSAQ